MLADIGQNQIRGDGCHLIKPCLAEFALDILFGGKAKAAMRLQTHIGGFP